MSFWEFLNNILGDYGILAVAALAAAVYFWRLHQRGQESRLADKEREIERLFTENKDLRERLTFVWDRLVANETKNKNHDD